MDRIDALREFLKYIEAGKDKTSGYLILMRAAFPYHDKTAHAAYNGSLDAAKALHEAVLPGWMWGRMPSTDCMWVVPDTAGRKKLQRSENKCPARAWLIAILRALIATEQDEGAET